MQSDQFKRPRFTQSWDQGTLRDALRDSGFFLLELPGPTVKAIAHLQRLLDAFFKRSTDKKKQFSEPITLVGYRPQGIEYSADPQRPDMMESFSYNSAYGHRLRKLAVDS
ncbi:MAG: 2-oxoglutarate and iron-dependent oxygenase domain-containing protein, partial [Pseudomonadales bacterium]